MDLQSTLDGLDETLLIPAMAGTALLQDECARRCRCESVEATEEMLDRARVPGSGSLNKSPPGRNTRQARGGVD